MYKISFITVLFASVLAHGSPSSSTKEASGKIRTFLPFVCNLENLNTHVKDSKEPVLVDEKKFGQVRQVATFLANPRQGLLDERIIRDLHVDKPFMEKQGQKYIALPEIVVRVGSLSFWKHIDGIYEDALEYEKEWSEICLDAGFGERGMPAPILQGVYQYVEREFKGLTREEGVEKSYNSRWNFLQGIKHLGATALGMVVGGIAGYFGTSSLEEGQITSAAAAFSSLGGGSVAESLFEQHERKKEQHIQDIFNNNIQSITTKRQRLGYLLEKTFHKIPVFAGGSQEEQDALKFVEERRKTALKNN